jgi:hypothetical protein
MKSRQEELALGAFLSIICAAELIIIGWRLVLVAPEAIHVIKLLNVYEQSFIYLEECSCRETRWDSKCKVSPFLGTALEGRGDRKPLESGLL